MLTSCKSVLSSTFTLPEPLESSIKSEAPKGSFFSNTAIRIGNLGARLLSTGLPQEDLSFARGMKKAHSVQTRIGRESTEPQTRLSSALTVALALPLAVLNIALKATRCVVHLLQALYHKLALVHPDRKESYYINHTNAMRFKLGQAVGDLASIPLEIGRLVYIVFCKYGPGIVAPSLASDPTTNTRFSTLFALTTPPRESALGEII